MTLNQIRDGFNSVQYEPVAQTFFGFRAFKVASMGRPLTGPATSGVVQDDDDSMTPRRGGLRGIFKSEFQWGAEANHAVCLRSRRPSAVDRVQGKPHSLMLPECDCGFWAYTNGTHALAVSGPAVLGIIEGWGRCVVGTHGFRAEKARIVALAFPTEDEADRAMIDSTAAHIADAVTQAMHALTAGFVSMAQALHRMAGHQQQPVPVLSPPPRARRPWEGVDAQLADDVQRGYPHARVFRSLADMHKAFPLSDLSGLLPEPIAPSESDA